MKDMIHCQRDIPRDQLRYGFRASADTGCGWIATYNALRILGKRADKQELIRYYERQLPLIHGNAGTSFWGPAVCFRKWGFPVKPSTGSVGSLGSGSVGSVGSVATGTMSME